jgi:hypothetical protein
MYVVFQLVLAFSTDTNMGKRERCGVVVWLAAADPSRKTRLLLVVVLPRPPSTHPRARPHVWAIRIFFSDEAEACCDLRVSLMWSIIESPALLVSLPSPSPPPSLSLYTC